MSNSIDIESVVASLRDIRKDILNSMNSNSISSFSVNQVSMNSTNSIEWIRRYDPSTNQYSYFHSTTHSLYLSNPWTPSSSTVTILTKPDEWIQMYDEREGKILVFQPSSGKEQWIHPTLGIAEENTM